MLFWSVMGASIASALLPLINIEAILVVSVSQAPGQMWGLLVAATIGQMLGKILWYWGGLHLERAPWVHRQLEKPKARASLDKWHERAEGRPWFTAGLLFVTWIAGIVWAVGQERQARALEAELRELEATTPADA